MPLLEVPNFCGPTNVVTPVNLDVERSINLYYEPAAPGTGKTPGALVKRPGTRPVYQLDDSPVRGLFYQDSRAFAVAGLSFYELFNDGTWVKRGTMTAQGPEQASIVSNGSAGHQILISSGGGVYVFDLNANTFASVTTGLEPVRMLEFMDGYFLALKADSREFGWSALEDGTTWDPLDVAERSEGSDNIYAMIRSHREIWLLGTLTSEVWVDSGDALNPFAPQPGVFVEMGIVQPFAVTRCDNTIIWCGLNANGNGVIWKASGYTPQRTSTHAIEEYVQIPTLGDFSTRTFSFQMGGHLFYVFVVPDLPTSLVYDVATGLWFEWAEWDALNCVWLPLKVGTYAFAFGEHLAGDRSSGVIYSIRTDVYTDELAA